MDHLSRPKDLAFALVIVVPLLGLAVWSTFEETWPASFFIELQLVGSQRYSPHLTLLVTVLSLFGVPATLAFLWSGARSLVLARRVPVPAAWQGFGRARR